MSALEEAPLIENHSNFPSKPCEENDKKASEVSVNSIEGNDHKITEESDDTYASLNSENQAVVEENSPTLISMTENISRVLTLEEIIANDNETSRQNYLSANTSPVAGNTPLIDDGSSVSSGLPSDSGSFVSIGSKSQSSSTFGFQMNDPFRGVDDDDFSNLDRFGFLTTASSSKMMSAASIDEKEFIERERKRIENEKEREASRSLKWLSMLKSLDEDKSVNNWPEVHKKFVPRLIKGIPDCLRTRVWAQLLETVGLYNDSCSNQLLEDVKKSEFSSLYLKVSGFERQIDLDIERTLRDHVLFKIRYSQAQISLFKILVAYSNLDPEVGYCQGMSTIAAFLLLYFDESGAFDAFVKLMARDDLRLMYKNGFPLLFEYFWIQERLMKKFLPNLCDHFQKHSITTSIYATKWYLTLFLSFPTRLAARIWDLFLFYGIDLLPLTAVALLKMHEKRICRMGFEETMQFLGKIADAPSCSSSDELLRLIGKLAEKYYGQAVRLDKKNCRGFVKYRKEYESEQAKQNSQK